MAGEDASVRDSSSSSSSSATRQSFLLSLPDSIKFISRRIPRSRCYSQCQCPCHRASEPKTQNKESGKFNSTKCSNPQCRSRDSRKTEFIIRDPMLLRREFVLSLICRGVQISCSIKTRPIVPASSAVIKCAENGDLVSLKNLLLAGKASIFDTEPDGWSLLHVSTMLQHQSFPFH